MPLGGHDPGHYGLRHERGSTEVGEENRGERADKAAAGEQSTSMTFILAILSK
jgi:hypothetical protein